MFEAYLLTLIGVVLAQASPGPNLFAVASAALGQGRRAALFTVGGIASGMLIWATLSALGLAALIALYPGILTVLKLLGGAYLLYMAFKALRAAASAGVPSIAAQKRERSWFACWLHGLTVLLTNPKAALMWASVGAFLFGSGLGAWQVIAFGPVAAISAALIYGSYGLLFSTGLAMRAYMRFARWIEAAFGGVFGLLGGKLFYDGVRELR